MTIVVLLVEDGDGFEDSDDDDDPAQMLNIDMSLDSISISDAENEDEEVPAAHSATKSACAREATSFKNAFALVMFSCMTTFPGDAFHMKYAA